jgi:hypothetical protein
MPSCCVDVPSVTSIVRCLRGSSNPLLVNASDGHRYVVKTAERSIRPECLFSEAMGYELFRIYNLPVPEWRVLRISQVQRRREGGLDEIDPGSSVTLCFGSRFLPDLDETYQIIPMSTFGSISNRQSFWTAWLLDCCARHSEFRKTVFCGNPFATTKAFFINHDQMFGSEGNSDCIAQASYSDPRIYCQQERLTVPALRRTADAQMVNQLWRFATSLPADWRTGNAESNFGDCLERLTDPSGLRFIADQISELLAQRRPARARETTQVVGGGSQHRDLFGEKGTKSAVVPCRPRRVGNRSAALTS